MSLAPRILHRTPRLVLLEELAESAWTLMATGGIVALGGESLLKSTRDVAEAAAEAGVTLALLKGLALHFSGRTPIESRGATDVDVLAAEESLAALVGGLETRGYHEVHGGPPVDHQLPTLQRDPGEAIEIHRFLPGVRIKAKGAFADLEGLLRAGLLEGVPSLPGQILRPRPAVLVAHALVHGLAQHGFAPEGYSLMRMFADLVDLDCGAPEGRDAWEEARVLVKDFVSGSEASAAWDLCARLRFGPPFSSSLLLDVPAEALLSHAVAGALDEEYQRALKLRVLGSTPSQHSRWVSVARDVWRSLFPPSSQLRTLYPERAPAIRLISRPFRQLARALGSSWHAFRLPRRSPRGGRSSWTS